MAFPPGVTKPWTSVTMSGPKIVKTSQIPNPISADVAARRTATESSRPKDSHRATYRNVARTQATSRMTSSPWGTMPSRSIPKPEISRTTATSTSPMTARPAANLPLMTSSR